MSNLAQMHNNTDLNKELAVKIMVECIDPNINVKDIPGILKSIYQTVCRLGEEDTRENPKLSKKEIEDSIKDDHLVCFEDGAKLKMLQRHLRTKCGGMTFQEYKNKWGLPNDYPSTCPSYSKVRANLAKKSRLGYHGKVKKNIKDIQTVNLVEKKTKQIDLVF